MNFTPATSLNRPGRRHDPRVPSRRNLLHIDTVGRWHQAC